MTNDRIILRENKKTNVKNLLEIRSLFIYFGVRGRTFLTNVNKKY